MNPNETETKAGAGIHGAEGLSRSGVAVIIGRPSSGKSTFLNAVCKENVAIVSPVPQTTRNAIRGIVNSAQGQIVFIDTPGCHQSEKKLNIRLQQVAKGALVGADAVLYLIDSSRPAGTEEALTAQLLTTLQEKTVVALNKTDLAASDTEKAASFVRQSLGEIPESRILRISAKDKSGLDGVLSALYELLPAAPKLYPEEYYTDQDVAFRIAEVIRGEAISRLDEEIPHAIYVDIADTEFRNGGNTLWVRAFLCVERESQKGIVIGKGASMIKAIRLESLKKLRKIFDYRIDLDLHVKLDKNWRQRDKTLNKLLR